MQPFTLNNINYDTMLTPLVRTRLLGIRNAIEGMCIDGGLDYDFPDFTDPGWIITTEEQGERINNNLSGRWTWENRWTAVKENTNGADPYKIEMGYHFNPALSNIPAHINALWMRCNEKNIYLYMPLGLVGLSVIVFSQPMVYNEADQVGYIQLPGFPNFDPPFREPFRLNRRMISHCADFNEVVTTALQQLCYLCTR